jgi:flagellar assembly factor FliW
MKWNNVQFGEMDFEEKHVVYFPNGIIGFEDCRKFLIVNDEGSEPFRWLISLEDSELSFPIIDPALVHPHFTAQNFPSQDVLVFSTVAIRSELSQSTVNLKSPLVINNTDRTGKQIVLENESLGVRTPLAQLAEPVLE